MDPRAVLFFGFLFALFGYTFSKDYACPPEEEIRPCYCLKKEINSLVCEKVYNAETLKDVMAAASHWVFHEFRLIQSSMQYIYADMFMNTKIQNHWFTNVTLIQMFDKVPQYLNDTIFMYLNNVRVMKGLSWATFSPMQRLNYLEFENTPIRRIDDDFNAHVPKSITTLSFMHTKTKQINSGAFKSFDQLRFLRVAFNYVKKLSRDMFPRPFLKVQYFDFRGNSIESLPADLFEEMPSLKEVNIGDNGLTMLPEDTFSPIWKQLNRLGVEGNPIKCDCRMSWMAEIRKPVKFYGECKSPQRLRGFQLIDLTTEELGC